MNVDRMRMLRPTNKLRGATRLQQRNGVQGIKWRKMLVLANRWFALKTFRRAMTAKRWS
jgi:hypothetical protein